MFAALLDTNVLWPSLRRDFVLSLAVVGLYRPLWSDQILEELRYCEERKLQLRGEPNAAGLALRLIEQMRLHFGDAEVTDWDRLSPYGLPDADDEHVLAAAVRGGAGVIVTENHKDFPTRLLPDDIEVISPAAFARDAVSVDPARALYALEEMSRRRTGQSIADLLDALDTRYNLHDATALLRG